MKRYYVLDVAIPANGTTPGGKWQVCCTSQREMIRQYKSAVEMCPGGTTIMTWWQESAFHTPALDRQNFYATQVPGVAEDEDEEEESPF